jgi:hypothetical protein
MEGHGKGLSGRTKVEVKEKHPTQKKPKPNVLHLKTKYDIPLIENTSRPVVPMVPEPAEASVTPFQPDAPSPSWVEPLRIGPPTEVAPATGYAKPNGDETDARMDKIATILGYAETPLLGRCDLVAEWVGYAETKLSVFGQIVPKPQGGRPESGISRAARELPVPGKSPEARRKYIERALKINGIWPEAKAAARTARLDDNQSALLAIAKAVSREAQLTKVQELANRKPEPRNRGKTAAHGATPETSAAASSEIIVLESLSDEQEAQLTALKASWADSGILTRADWKKSDHKVRLRFARDVLTEAAA